ncbi:glycerate kinase [Amycolatopsis sp. YIM 10]|uniref:glycerate kinase n=1 Tax=Amycolatopsis sp. YIM 10 TaxID=2653857 RepID=UPI0012904008|nr:glycerate kinase [Amycolatopsis sp. YIM 10]QFU89026.1 Glycerate 2-kinase [Amycolatopsis sp. YIM 10]
MSEALVLIAPDKPTRRPPPPPSTVLVAPDKFKGSLSAAEVAAAVAAGIAEVRPEIPVRSLPVADGGDGTVEAVVSAGFRRLRTVVTGPAGQPVAASLAVRGDTAVVELAEASGLHRLPGGPSKTLPLTATSAGTGELIAAALRAGRRRVVLGVGGSACTDGGAGMLTALGARLLDAKGGDLPPGGAALLDLDRLDLSGLDPRLSEVDFELATDVDNPLLGTRGAAAVYGPQKGATPEQVELLDRALHRWASLVGTEHVDAPGAGAAGGVGFAALSLLGAKTRPGIEVVLDLLDFPAALRGARLVITGEGSLDAQTLHGKAPSGVARAAGDVPVIAVAGRCLLSPPELAAAGFRAAYALSGLEPDPTRSMADAARLLRRQAAQLARDHLQG